MSKHGCQSAMSGGRSSGDEFFNSSADDLRLDGDAVMHLSRFAAADERNLA